MQEQIIILNRRKKALKAGIPLIACGAIVGIASMGIIFSITGATWVTVFTFLGFAMAAAGAFLTSAIGKCGRKVIFPRELAMERQAQASKHLSAASVNANMGAYAYANSQPQNFQALQIEYKPNVCRDYMNRGDMYGGDMFRIPEAPAVNDMNKSEKDIEMGIKSDCL